MSRPDSCASCGRMIFRYAVTCEGPCKLFFHLTCASLQLDVEPSFFDELSWVCDGCRLILQLPPEIWTEIFDLLDGPDLLNIRLTCRSWRQLVDESSTLRRHLKVRVAGRITLDEEVPCAGGAVLRERRIVSGDSWWPAFGEKLTYLELNECEVEMPILLEMLRRLPLLKELILIDVSLLDEAQNTGVNLQLDNLEKLTLLISNNSYEDEKEMFLVIFLNLFTKTRPHLRYLAVHGIFGQEAFIEMVKAVQITLKEITFDATNMVLEALSELEQLKLRHVGIVPTTTYDRDYFAMFFRAQPNIVELSICQDALQFLTDKEFTRLKLVSLKVYLYKTSTLNIALMPTLKTLEIEAISEDRPTTRFGTCLTPNLQELRLFGVRIVGNCLTNFLASCTHLQRLQLVQINTDVSMDLGTLPPAVTFSAMKTLRIQKFTVPKQLLLDLFRLCPNLANLELALDGKVDDDGWQHIFQQLKWQGVTCVFKR